MDIEKIKDLLYAALIELEKLEKQDTDKNIMANKVNQKMKMRLYDAYAKGIIDKDTLERELRKLNQSPPTIY